jgi:TPR repeat protein
MNLWHEAIRGGGGEPYFAPGDPRYGLNDMDHSVDLALAEYRVGEYYEKGLGVPRDYAAAAFWYQKSVQNTYADFRPRAALGLLYAHGLGVPRDPAKARAVFGTMGYQGQPLMALLDAGKLPKSIDGLPAAEAQYAATQKKREEEANEAQYEAFEHAFAASNAAQRQAPEESGQPSWYTCHSVLSGAPTIAGMAGCSPW